MKKEFKLPTNPFTKKEQSVVVEKPSKDSVWYLVLDSEGAIPLVNLSNPTSAKQVLNELGKQNGESAVQQFVMGGFSK